MFMRESTSSRTTNGVPTSLHIFKKLIFYVYSNKAMRTAQVKTDA